jgi:hypothetical protein
MTLTVHGRRADIPTRVPFADLGARKEDDAWQDRLAAAASSPGPEVYFRGEDPRAKPVGPYTGWPPIRGPPASGACCSGPASASCPS